MGKDKFDVELLTNINLAERKLSYLADIIHTVDNSVVLALKD